MLKAKLPAEAAARLQSLRAVDGVVTLVLDGEGLDERAAVRLEQATRAALAQVPGVTELRVAMMGERRPQPTGPRIIAVASGKGGVGKSTVSANLAVALARRGLRVGLVDADIQGPSQARLLGAENERPVAHDKRLVPVASRWGVPMLSMAQLAGAGEAIAWRGSMVAGAMVKMLEAHWDHAEVLIVDLPPGTGDIQLTLAKQFPPSGIVIVSTPQDLALIDAARATGLFRKLGVPIVGLIENMAGYACPHCGEVSDPFGCGGAEASAAEQGLDFLGRIPLDIAIRRQSDEGVPVAAGDGAQAEAFAALAARVADWLETQSPDVQAPDTSEGAR
ncbi:Mrp/NBP35 family ATP-binding protein [Novosphingobium sp. 9]|uniref:Mrp/NBP35 family ATP-binding protein n=1 Tax=Novosphingobium sp. 9 TaxID=2025349 RepID=UPI0021B5F408|nr:Mrp/NBP35 family ATP-binding protein [Novosphingobium sp. 9]